MGTKTAEWARPDVKDPNDKDPNDAGLSHPFDDWLRRELKAHLAEPENEPLPKNLIDLIDELEGKLAATSCRGEKRDPD